MSSSRRSSNLRVVRISPEISFSSNFSTIAGSNPAWYIHLATWRGVHMATSILFSFVTAAVSVLIGLCFSSGCGYGIDGTLNAVSGRDDGGYRGVTGDIVR